MNIFSVFKRNIFLSFIYTQAKLFLNGTKNNENIFKNNLIDAWYLKKNTKFGKYTVNRIPLHLNCFSGFFRITFHSRVCSSSINITQCLHWKGQSCCFFHFDQLRLSWPLTMTEFESMMPLGMRV